MALYSVQSSLKFIVLALALQYLFVTPIHSSARKFLDRDKPKLTERSFRVALKHVDHGENYTKLERMQRGVDRARLRVQNLNAKVSASGKSVKSRVQHGTSEFLMDMAVGTPPNSFPAIMDTGSDLIWTQCLPGFARFRQPTPIFEPLKSSTYSNVTCNTTFCQSLPFIQCVDPIKDNDDLAPCQYTYTYSDESYSEGVLAFETFTFDSGLGSEKVRVPNIAFGCGGQMDEDDDDDNHGDYIEGIDFSQGSGLVGMGRGELSLVSQLNVTKFSYCLTSVDANKTSTLILGSLANYTNTKLSTPLVQNPSIPSLYYVTLEGITVGSTRLPISKETFALKKDGNGGVIFDSGTTITLLERAAYRVLKKEFISKMKLPLVDGSGWDSAGLDLCFKRPHNTSSLKIPKLIFHFQGADLELPSENYIVDFPNFRMLCLAMGYSDGYSIFGNVQQQNLMVVYDLVKESLSFVACQCDTL